MTKSIRATNPGNPGFESVPAPAFSPSAAGHAPVADAAALPADVRSLSSVLPVQVRELLHLRAQAVHKRAQLLHSPGQLLVLR